MRDVSETLLREVCFMKIQGPNRTNFNPYNQIMNKQKEVKQEIKKADQLQISEEAKSLLEKEDPAMKRKEKVAELKAKVAANEYEIDYEKTAKKLINFWSNQR